MNNKTDLRLKALSIRKELNIKNISSILCDKLKDLYDYKIAKHVMLFYPLKFEINTLELLDDKDKTFYFPRINENSLEVCQYKKGDDLAISAFKTLEPVSKAINPNILDLIIVPALMVDKYNFRLGYGKGFYDRFLTNINVKTVVLISRNLLIDKLPTEEHDKPIDIVLTD